MTDIRCEGVVLRSTPYKDHARIISLFTPCHWVLSLYVRGLSKKHPAKINLTTPLTRAEFVFKKGKSDLYTFVDGTILDLHLDLRSSYSHLDAAGKILQSILKTQMPGKSAAPLYVLLTSFLSRLEKAKFPETFWATFELKLLKYEGLIDISPKCNNCHEKNARMILDGESQCPSCSKGGGVSFASNEWELLQNLFEERSMTSLQTKELPPSLLQGVDALFQNALAH